jgi:hypothetical protein
VAEDYVAEIASWGVRDGLLEYWINGKIVLKKTFSTSLCVSVAYKPNLTEL